MIAALVLGLLAVAVSAAWALARVEDRRSADLERAFFEAVGREEEP